MDPKTLSYDENDTAMKLAYFSCNGTLSPRKKTEIKEINQTKESMLTNRLQSLDQHNKIRSQTACSKNSYIKPKALLNFSVDYSAFERF